MSSTNIQAPIVTAQLGSKTPLDLKPAHSNLKKTHLVTKRKQTRWLEAYKQNGSSVTLTSEITGIPVQTYYYWLNSHPDFKTQLESADHYLNDLAVEGLRSHLKKQTLTAIRFQLEKRDPRYMETPRVNIYDQRQLTINYPHWS